jgi:hypothetical protein
MSKVLDRMEAKSAGRYIVTDPGICHGQPIFRDPDEETIRQAHHKYSPVDDLQIDSENGS